MNTRRLSKMLHRTKRRAPAEEKIKGDISAALPCPAQPHRAEPCHAQPDHALSNRSECNTKRLAELTAQAIAATHGPIHHDRTFGSGSDRLWCHICMGQQIEFVAPACEGLPLRSAVLHRSEFEAMVSWIRAEFDSISKPKTARPAQHAQFVN
jgi:hypothetical protein